MKKVIIDSDYITLTQFLKIEGFINSGGEAKIFLSNQEVFLNGNLENRRGKKLYSGYVVRINDEEFLIE